MKPGLTRMYYPEGAAGPAPNSAILHKRMLQENHKADVARIPRAYWRQKRYCPYFEMVFSGKKYRSEVFLIQRHYYTVTKFKGVLPRFL